MEKTPFPPVTLGSSHPDDTTDRNLEDQYQGQEEMKSEGQFPYMPKGGYPYGKGIGEGTFMKKGFILCAAAAIMNGFMQLWNCETEEGIEGVEGGAGPDQ